MWWGRPRSWSTARGLEHLADGVGPGRPAARRGGGGLPGVLEPRLEALVGGVEREPLLVGGDSAGGVAEAEVRGAEPRVALGPVGLELDGLLRVGERVRVAVERGERGGAVGVEDVVARGERDGVREVPRRLLVAAGGERRITLGLRLVGHGGSPRGVRSDRASSGGFSKAWRLGRPEVRRALAEKSGGFDGD